MKRWRREPAQSAFRDEVALKEDQDLWVLGEGEREDEGDEESLVGMGNGVEMDRHDWEEV